MFLCRMKLELKEKVTVTKFHSYDTTTLAACCCNGVVVFPSCWLPLLLLHSSCSTITPCFPTHHHFQPLLLTSPSTRRRAVCLRRRRRRRRRPGRCLSCRMHSHPRARADGHTACFFHIYVSPVHLEHRCAGAVDHGACRKCSTRRKQRQRRKRGLEQSEQVRASQDIFGGCERHLHRCCHGRDDDARQSQGWSDARCAILLAC